MTSRQGSTRMDSQSPYSSYIQTRRQRFEDLKKRFSTLRSSQDSPLMAYSDKTGSQQEGTNMLQSQKVNLTPPLYIRLFEHLWSRLKVPLLLFVIVLYLDPTLTH